MSVEKRIREEAWRAAKIEKDRLKRQMRSEDFNPRDRSVGDQKVMYRSLLGENTQYRTLSKFEIGFRSISGTEVEPATIGLFELHNDIKGPNGGLFGLRKLGGSGAAFEAAHFDHFHSIPFTRLPKEERLRLISLRQELRGSPASIEREVFLVLLHMAMDDPDLSAEERERRLEDPKWAEWAEQYKLDHLMDDYEEIRERRARESAQEKAARVKGGFGVSAKSTNLEEAEKRLKAGGHFVTAGEEGWAHYDAWLDCYVLKVNGMPVVAVDINELYSRMEGFGLTLEAWGLVGGEPEKEAGAERVLRFAEELKS